MSLTLMAALQDDSARQVKACFAIRLLPDGEFPDYASLAATTAFTKMKVPDSAQQKAQQSLSSIGQR